MRLVKKCAPYLLLTFFLLASPSASAQTQPRDRAGYEAGLVRLSEILGSLHYLRPLCGGAEQGQWRVEMQALIDDAALPAGKRAMLVTSFNRGYATNERTHRSCTTAARAAAERLLDEGGRLARDIAQRHGN